MKATEKNKDNDVPLDEKLDDLYKLIDGIETAMLTTRRPDGSLVSRPMATQRRTAGVDLWFMTNIDSNKLDELAFDTNVNVAYYKDRTREWVSVSGNAVLSRDPQIIESLWAPDWRMWLGDEGGERDGSATDPRIALILVRASSVVYSKQDRPTPMVLFALARGMITGTPPKVADLREVSEGELRTAMKLSTAGEIFGR